MSLSCFLFRFLNLFILVNIFWKELNFQAFYFGPVLVFLSLLSVFIDDVAFDFIFHKPVIMGFSYNSMFDINWTTNPLENVIFLKFVFKSNHINVPRNSDTMLWNCLMRKPNCVIDGWFFFPPHADASLAAIYKMTDGYDVHVTTNQKFHLYIKTCFLSFKLNIPRVFRVIEPHRARQTLFDLIFLSWDPSSCHVFRDESQKPTSYQSFLFMLIQ